MYLFPSIRFFHAIHFTLPYNGMRIKALRFTGTGTSTTGFAIAARDQKPEVRGQFTRKSHGYLHRENYAFP